MRGWLPFFAVSVRLGLRGLRAPQTRRQALIRLVVPLDPSRYIELPATLGELAARPGQRVLDLASPKLLAVLLARRGVEVVSVDASEHEVTTWRELAAHVPQVEFRHGDGRRLDLPGGSFDHAYSVSVIEHIHGDGGDAAALRELARAVKPGGRVILTMPFARHRREEWRDEPLYGAQDPGPDGRYFFQRWYDAESVRALLTAVPELRLVRQSVVRLAPNWQVAFERCFPWLIALGPFYGLMMREKETPEGDVVRLTLERR